MTTTPQIRGEFPPGYKIGGFVIEEVAGRGAMGVVYRAAQPALGRLVALKVIAEPLVADAAFRERFEREARAAAPLGHPNIVSVHEAGELDGVLYIAMQWVDGGDLRHHIAKTGPLPPMQAARAVSQIAEALDVAHAAGVLHRDVKPANILLRPLSSGLHAYLTDFGVTRPFVELSSSIDTLTQNGQIVGTPGFLAPEQIEGRDVDGRADLYALCCVLFEALTGRPPFQRDTAVATLLAHTSAPRPLVSEVNPNVGTAFDDLVRRGLAINRDERFADGKALIEALEAVLEQPQRLPRVTPLRHNRIDDLGTEVGPPRRRIVVSFEGEGEGDGEPAAVANPPRPEQPRSTGSARLAPGRSSGWPAPMPPVAAPRSRAVRSQVPAAALSQRRGRTNILLLIAGVVLIAGALLAFALSRGGDGAAATTTTDTIVPAASVAEKPKQAPDARHAIASTLRAYARAFATHDATALSHVLAQGVHRRAGGAPGTTGCQSTSTRRDALAIYRAQFATVTGYTLPQLHSSAIAFLGASQAAVATRAHISTVAGVPHDEVMRFVLRSGARGWRITTIEGAC